MLVADASPTTGVGHYVRSAALGEAFAASGWAVTVGLPGDSVRWVSEDARAKGWAVQVAGSGPPSLESLAGFRTDGAALLVVLDSYRLDGDALRRAREFLPGQLMVIDDLGDRELTAADVVLNQNVGADSMAMRVGDSACVLRGPRFALLRTQITARRAEGLAGVGHLPAAPRRVLVVMGGTDPSGSAPVVGAACRAAFPNAEVVVVSPGGAPACPDCELVVVSRIADMGAAILAADLVVTAAGSTLWEVCCLARPAAAVEVAPNQRDVYARLRDSGTVVGLGSAPVDGRDVTEALRRLIARPGALRDLARAGAALVDGRGAQRVVREVELHMRGVFGEHSGG